MLGVLGRERPVFEPGVLTEWSRRSAPGVVNIGQRTRAHKVKDLSDCVDAAWREDERVRQGVRKGSEGKTSERTEHH